MFQTLFGRLSGLRGDVSCDMCSVAHLHRANLVGFRADCPWSTHSFALASWSAAFWCGKLIEKINHTNVFSERRKSHFRGCSQQFHRFSNQFQMFLFFQAFQRDFIRVAGVCVCALRGHNKTF